MGVLVQICTCPFSPISIRPRPKDRQEKEFPAPQNISLLPSYREPILPKGSAEAAAPRQARTQLRLKPADSHSHSWFDRLEDRWYADGSGLKECLIARTRGACWCSTAGRRVWRACRCQDDWLAHKICQAKAQEPSSKPAPQGSESSEQSYLRSNERARCSQYLASDWFNSVFRFRRRTRDLPKAGRCKGLPWAGRAGRTHFRRGRARHPLQALPPRL